MPNHIPFYEPNSESLLGLISVVFFTLNGYGNKPSGISLHHFGRDGSCENAEASPLVSLPNIMFSFVCWVITARKRHGISCEAASRKTPGCERLIKAGFSLPTWCENIRHGHSERHTLTHPHGHKFSPYAKHTHKPNEGLDSSRWKDSAGGCTFIKPWLNLFTFEVIRARERRLCAQTHSYTCFLITLAPVFSLFLKTYWHVSIQQPRYITNEQF